MDISRFDKYHLIKLFKTRERLDDRYIIKFKTPNKIILELLDEHFGKGQYASLLDRWEQDLKTGVSEFFYIYLHVGEYDDVSYKGWDASDCASLKMYKNFPFFDERCNNLPLE